MQIDRADIIQAASAWPELCPRRRSYVLCPLLSGLIKESSFAALIW